MGRITLILASVLLGTTVFRDQNHEEWRLGHYMLCGAIAGWGLHEMFGGK